MQNTKLASITVLIIIVVSIVSCTDKKAMKQTVSISVPVSVSSIPILVLDGVNAGNTRIAVSQFQDHSLTLAEFIKGNIDILMTGFTQGLAVYEGNKKIVYLATPVWGVSSLMTRDKSLSTPGELAGKHVIVPFAKSPLDLQLRAILAAGHLLDKVTIEYGPVQQAIPLLLAGKTDAIAVPEPFASDLEIKGNARRLFTFQVAWAGITGGEGRSPQVSLFTTRTFAETHEEFLRALLVLVRQETEALVINPIEAADTFADVFHAGRDVVLAGIKNTLFDLPATKDSIALCSDYITRIGLKQPESGFYYEN
jgi:NitT/TauT family transport system substrate-binding protein